MNEPSDELKVAAVKLRLLGVDQRMVDYYLHCGDDSVLSILFWYENNPDTFEGHWRGHLTYLINTGKVTN
jgi:hypothetical protein